MTKVAICGATGYTGLELLRILLRHPKIDIVALTAKIERPTKISDVFAELKGRLDLVCKELDVGEVLAKRPDIVFLALPHRVSMEHAPKFLDKGKIVIDLSADFRLKDAMVYQRYYDVKHLNTKYLFASVYGLPELYASKIKKAKLIANPGCYPTGAILAVAPLVSKKVADTRRIIIDSKSGVTGAGRKAELLLSFGEVDENIRAYKIGVHQHLPEIEQELTNLARQKVKVIFTPHLIPINRGILTTAYVGLKSNLTTAGLIRLYRSFYDKSPFVRIYDEGAIPEIKDVLNTNYCDIGIAVLQDEKTAVIVSAIDNLQKGASGQAVQNMNIVLGFPETLGLV